MYEAMMIAAAGLRNQQTRIDTIADNVSNVNTTAFKSSRLDFKDALYTAGIVPGYPRTAEGNQQKGHGVMVAAVTKNFAAGSIFVTENPLDVAIEGAGFFELEDHNGNTLFTRNGKFGVGESDGDFYLVNAEGYFVHDADGMRIQVPEDTEAIEISEDGIITFLSGEEGTTVELGIFAFRNETGLVSVGGGNYAESEASGEKLPAEDITIRQGALEGSNVNLAEEMTRLIRTQRAFSLAARALTTADEMEGVANNMRK